MKYQVITKDGRAKRARMETVHGTVETPVFMNVGTVGAIKGAVSTDDLREIGTQVELGVHVGAEDMPVATARRLMGDDKIVGATAKTVPWAKEAYEQGADYLGVGAIYPTTTKVKTVLTSTDTLRDICNAVPIPANAIGGLNKGNIDVLTGIPIAGICVVSAIMKADDPKMATEELKARAHELALI